MFTLHPHHAQGPVCTSQVIGSQTSFNFGFNFIVKGVIPILVQSQVPKHPILVLVTKTSKWENAKKTKKQKN
jgi:hypothetical protein